MKHLLFFLCLLAALLFYTCCDDDNGIIDDDDIIMADPFEGCCGIAPLTFSQDGINIFLPNAFTPNNDGVNDFFYVKSGNSIPSAQRLTILTKNQEVIFSLDNPQLDNPSDSWDGKVNNDTIYAGLFFIQLEIIDTLGQVHIIEHRACCMPCDGEIYPINSTSDGCVFSLQHDGNGGYDESLHSGEYGCF